MRFKDYYEVLGVARDAPADAIKTAFRKLARKYHPDVSKEPDADARMKEVNEAYAVLSDPEKRAAYDQLGRDYRPGEEFRPPPDWDAGFEFSDHGFTTGEAAEFSDFFAHLFGSAAGEHGGARGFGGSFRAQGEDHHAKVLLDLEDAFTGTVRPITLRSPKVDADGRVSLDTRTLNVKIPKGIQEGQIIRLAGQGAPGAGRAPPGDLMLHVHFKPHARFRPEGRDLHMSLPVAPWEAALGATVPLTLPHGPINLRVPAGSQSGRTLRVRGKGLPSEPPGDLLLELEVVLPPADNDNARAIYARMASELAFNPRQER
jgi:curved DNA-binding protein